ncbi:MAG: hypothetical protein WC656_08670 [Sulfurimonas sp.]|jgi:hypothetical protein
MKKLLKFIALVSLFVFGASVVSAGDTGLEGTEVSAYLQGAYVDVTTAKTKLAGAGFEVIATYASIENGNTIVFTNAALKAEGAKPKRAFAAVLRLFIDNQAKTISITNPIYFGKAYMQDEYNHKVFNAQLEAINKAFAGLTPSADKLKFDDLAGYHFMISRPYYEDTIELAKGSNAELATKAKGFQDGKGLIFELKLSDKSTLLGYQLDDKTNLFVGKIGRANAAILPYCVSIEDGVVTMLHGEYYLALSYPLLDMGTFMTISSVPGAIQKDLEKPFN